MNAAPNEPDIRFFQARTLLELARHSARGFLASIDVEEAMLKGRSDSFTVKTRDARAAQRCVTIEQLKATCDVFERFLLFDGRHCVEP